MTKSKKYSIPDLYRFCLMVSTVDETGDATMPAYLEKCDLIDPHMTVKSFLEMYLLWAQGLNWREVVDKFCQPKWLETEADGTIMLLFDYQVPQDGQHGHKELVEMVIQDQYQCEPAQIGWADPYTCFVELMNDDEDTVH